MLNMSNSTDAAQITPHHNATDATTPRITMETPSSSPSLENDTEDKPADANGDAADMRNRLLSDFCRLIDSDPTTVDNWLRDQAPANVVRRLAAMTGDHDRALIVPPASTSTVPHNGSPKRAPSVTSELFQQWLYSSSSATASPRLVIEMAFGYAIHIGIEGFQFTTALLFFRHAVLQTPIRIPDRRSSAVRRVRNAATWPH